MIDARAFGPIRSLEFSESILMATSKVLGVRARPALSLLLCSLAAACAARESHAGGSACLGDLDGTSEVAAADLSILLNAWGSADPIADIDASGNVDASDLSMLLGSWGKCGPTLPIEVELAAVTASSYPWATHFDCVNRDDLLVIRIDPIRFSDLVGQSFEAFIIENRSALDWETNRLLVDVRGYSEEVWVGATLESSTVIMNIGTVVQPGLGDSPGRGFDLVIDVDRDGLLSSGDLIDGLGDGAGFWFMKDTAGVGPHAATTIASYDVNDPDILDSMELERIYYPSDIATLTPRPLVIISHGNGHNYAWYDYLGTHLARWGYVVMSHQNDTVPGIETASTTTLEHTESFIAQMATIGGGVLNGHIDTHRITWIGHSRGGEGIARAYDRMFDGAFVSPNYVIGDIKLLISIAPTDFLGTNVADPHGVPFMLLYGAADGDVCGCPDSDIPDSFNVFERASGMRQSTYIHGADHNDFNCCGTNDFAGPAGTALGNTEVQDVTKGATLAMIRRVIENDRSTEEFLWRQYESLRPASVAATTTVINEWRPATANVVMIDSFQTNSATTTSSAGELVTFSGIANVIEGVQNDNNLTFTWATTDPFNGATRGRTTDTTRAFAFNWTTASAMTWTVPLASRNFTTSRFVSLRAAQGSRHPNTVALLGDLSFTVVLTDELGVESAVSSNTLAGGVEEPYQRTGYGTGTGWQNAMEAIRVPLSSFIAGATTIDMTRIASISVRVGGTDGSAQGRLVIDDVQVERE